MTMTKPIITLVNVEKLVQKVYKPRHDMVEKVIHWELCKKLKLDQTTKWYMLKPESVLNNGTHTILKDFEIQTNHLIPARRPDLMIFKKRKKKKRRTCRENQRKWKKEDKYLDLARELRKLWNMRVTVIGVVGVIPKCLERELEKLEFEGRIETIQTEALLRLARILRRVLRRLAVTQTPMKV